LGFRSDVQQKQLIKMIDWGVPPSHFCGTAVL
jgi:hypothetical protein